MKLVRLFGFVLSLIVINIYFVTATNASGAMESNDTGSNGLKVEWNVTIGGNLSDTATSVHETTDGGYIIAGTTKSFSEPASIEDADVWLVKLDSSGNIQWNKTFEDTPSAKNPSVYQTHDGGYVISYSRLGNVIDVIKTDFNGNKEWNKSTNNQLSYSISIKEMINNDYLLVGAIKFSSFIIFKTDSNASPYFNKTVNAFFAHSFDETSDGGFILTTQQNSDQSINSIKLDNNFNEIWNKDYGESIRNWIKQVTSESADGNYLIVGSGDYPGCCLNGSTNIFLFKIDLNGNQIWNKSFEGQGRDVINSMAKSSDNGHILVGGTDSFGHGSHDVWIVRLDSDGNIKWNSTIGGPFYDSANSIKPTSDGGYIVVGNTTSLATGEDMWIIKLAQINHSSIGINYFNPVNLRPNVTEPNNVSFTVFPDTSDNVVISWYKNSSLQATGTRFLFQGGFASAGSYNITAVLSRGSLSTSISWNLTVVNETVFNNPLLIKITNPANNSTITSNFTWINVTTNKNVTCQYTISGSTTFPGGGAGGGSIARNMSETGNTKHSQMIDILHNNWDYLISVACTDIAGNITTTSVTFFVAFPQPGEGGGGETAASSLGLKINILFPINNSVVEESALLELSVNKYAVCNYSLDGGTFTGLQEAQDEIVTLPPGITVEGDARQISTSINRLELSEDGTSSKNVETIRNITTYMDKSDLNALFSGLITNSKATSPFNQYLYLLGPGAEKALDTGYVIYTESDDDSTADFLYFKSGREIARYLLEFTTALESDVDDSTGTSSATGLFLTDYQDVDLNLFGKKYTIVTAKRTSTVGNSVALTLMSGATKDTLLEKQTKTYIISGKNYEVTLNFVDADEAQFIINGQSTRKLKDGDTDKLADGTTIGVTDVLYQDYAGGIHSSTFVIGANKLELKDTNVKDVASSNALKVDDNTIDDAQVIIEGSDNNITFKISKIHVNMSADDNFFVPAGGKLSEAIKLEGGTSAEPEVLFTQNWDIEYRGLIKEATESVKIRTSGSSEYRLEFVDGGGKKVSLPIAKAPSGSQIIFGEDANKRLINKENRTIGKDDYFVISDSSSSRKRGERSTYALQYKGADKITNDNPLLKFNHLGTGDTIEQTYSNKSVSTVVGPDGVNTITELATLKVGGSDFKVWAANGIGSNDFDVTLDLDASGAVNTGDAGNDSAPIVITTKNGMEINVTNTTGVAGFDNTDVVFVTFRIPDESRDGSARDSVESLLPTVMRWNITAASAKVQMAQDTTTEAGRLNLRTPSGKTNIAYAYDSYGNFYTYETPTNDPAQITIEVPAKQKVPLVYITTKGATFGEPIERVLSKNKDKWKVGTSTKKLELSEDLVLGINRELLSDITTFIQKGDLKALDSGSVINNKAASPYSQYFYLLGAESRTSLDNGYVIYSEDDDNDISDYLYIKSGKEIGRYLLEFTPSFESGIYDDSSLISATGLSLKDFKGSNLKLLGKSYTISNATRTSAIGNGVELTLVNEADKLELKDTNIKDFASTDTLTSNGNVINNTFVIIEGSDDNVTFKINRIHVNMTAEGDYYIKPGTRLSDAIAKKGNKQESLFTENWDVAYLGLNEPISSKIKLNNSGMNQYNLEFQDGHGVHLSVPIATSPNGTQILFGDVNKPLINQENLPISKNSYFILTDSTLKRGDRKSFILEYLGSDNITAGNPMMVFEDLGLNQSIEVEYTNTSPLAAINIGGSNYKIFASNSAKGDLSIKNFDINIDLDNNGILNEEDSNVVITTAFGAEINVTNQTSNSILLSIRTPDNDRDINAEDNVDTIYPSVLIFNITANDGIVNHAKIGNLNFRTPNAQSYVEYTFASYGTFVKREFQPTKPATLDIDYPSTQRLPFVYYEAGNIQSKLLENLTEAQHNITIVCSDIFGNATSKHLSFSSVSPSFQLTSYSPLNNSVNISLNTTIEFNFNKLINPATLTPGNVMLSDSKGHKIRGRINYDFSSRKIIFDPYLFLLPDENYMVDLLEIEDLSGNELKSEVFWIFKTAQLDMDKDGIPDIEDDDKDNDGIDDKIDFIRGNLSNINSNFANLSIRIDFDHNLSKQFNGTKPVEFFNGERKLLWFNYAFTNETPFDFSNITVLNASNSSLGGTIIRGIGLSKLGIKKAAVIDKIDTKMNGICIKDEEIDWIDNISPSCDNENEFKIECDGTEQNGYMCIYNSTINAYQVGGLSHSGIIQFDYTKSSGSNSGSSSSSGSSGGSSGGSGGGGGGGGGASGFVCFMEWKCVEWSACSNGLQTRQCEFVRVPQHVQDAQCPDSSNPPVSSQTCEVKKETPATSSSISIEESKTATKPLISTTAQSNPDTETSQERKSALSAITGAVTKIAANPKAAKEVITAFIMISILLISGIIFYRQLR